MAVVEVPLPKPWAGVVFPYAVVVPHSNHPLVTRPLGLIVALRVALLDPIDEAGLIATVGGCCTGADTPVPVKGILELPPFDVKLALPLKLLRDGGLNRTPTLWL